MTLSVEWGERALTGAARFMTDDSAGLELVMRAVDLLANDPRPDGATQWGGEIFRIHIGRYRLLYEIDAAAVRVLHLARIP